MEDWEVQNDIVFNTLYYAVVGSQVVAKLAAAGRGNCSGLYVQYLLPCTAGLMLTRHQRKAGRGGMTMGVHACHKADVNI